MSIFVSYVVSVELVRDLKPLIPIIKKYDRDLADQLQRAASSVVLNLSEGQRLMGGNQRRHYEIAHGSANEVRAALELVDAWGYAGNTAPALRTLSRLLALLWGLNHGKRMRAAQLSS